IGGEKAFLRNTNGAGVWGIGDGRCGYVRGIRISNNGGIKKGRIVGINGGGDRDCGEKSRDGDGRMGGIGRNKR
ncbi:hypothetical protein, partial [Staphylococcus saprophyticus]|uniref:hypothetical protein n=1 Tax=Staphylococcus saprophyticus TaxID=29385 RepID=UPI0016429B73